MSVDIIWNEGTLGEWARRFSACRRSTLTQVLGYARATAKTEGWLPRLGLIRRDEHPVGLVQILERRVARLFRSRRLHRGPLWFDGVPDEATLGETLSGLRRACPAGLLTRFDFLPELPDDEVSRRLLTDAGFRRVGEGYRTVWLDLRPGLDEIRAGFSRTWRQRLRSAERAGLAIKAAKQKNQRHSLC